MQQFSIVVPHVGSVEDFELTLASVLRHRPPRTQVLAVHNSNYHDPYGLSGEIELLPVGGPKSLVRLWNAALCHAHGEWIALFTPGTELNTGWVDSIRPCLADPTVAAISPSLGFKTPSQLTHSICGIRVDRSGTRILASENSNAIGPQIQAALYRNDSLGWLPEIDESWGDDYLDAEIAWGLRDLGFRFVHVPEWEVSTNRLIYGNGPHGVSAQRSLTRHGQPGLVSALMSDLRNAIRSPWRLRHLLQRFQVPAGTVKIDRRSHKQLELNYRLVAQKSAGSSGSLERRRAA